MRRAHTLAESRASSTRIFHCLVDSPMLGFNPVHRQRLSFGKSDAEHTRRGAEIWLVLWGGCDHGGVLLRGSGLFSSLSRFQYCLQSTPKRQGLGRGEVRGAGERGWGGVAGQKLFGVGLAGGSGAEIRSGNGALSSMQKEGEKAI